MFDTNSARKVLKPSPWARHFKNIHFVYVLRSLWTQRYYTGSTSDVARRLIQHNEGITRSIKGGRPWTGVHQEQFETRAEALRRERYQKTGKGRDELKRLLHQCGQPD